MRKLRSVILIFLVFVLVAGLSACSNSGTVETIKINDRGEIKEVEVTLPDKVGKILEEAGYTLNDGDEVEPPRTSKITEPGEIIIRRKNVFKFTHNGVTKEIVFVGGQVKDFLEQEGIVLKENQMVRPSLDTYLTDGIEIVIGDQIKIKVTEGGKTEDKSVDALTVSEALENLGITLEKDDRVTPDKDAPVTEGMEIVINRVKIETVTETELIDYEVYYTEDNALPKGEEEVITQGEYGQKTVEYEVVTVDGEEESRKVLKETVTKEPVNGFVLVGVFEGPTVTQDNSSVDAGDVINDDYVDPEAHSGETYTVIVYYEDDPGHGYYEYHYADGTVEYVDF